jgi:hypothetical protein
MVAAFRGVITVIAELRQLVVKGLDRSLLLAQQILDQLVAVGFMRLLLSKEFVNVVIWHFHSLAGTIAVMACIVRLLWAELRVLPADTRRAIL